MKERAPPIKIADMINTKGCDFLDVLDSISAASMIIGILVGGGSILAGVFKTMSYVTQNIVAPMQVSISQLSSVTKELKVLLEQVRRDTREQDRRITICEQSVKSAHHRLDGLEERVNKIEIG